MLVLVRLASLAPAFAAPWQAKPTGLERIVVSPDRKGFIRDDSKAPFVVRGFNYDHDDQGRLIEDYWAKEWPTVVEDFQEMRDLGANVVRIHLQIGKFLDAADLPNRANLDQLKKLVKLAEDVGLYLDVTGLACYHKQEIPKWYDALDESERWNAQAAFWRAVARTCKDSNSIFCYDLMNEPVGPGEKKDDWLPGEPLGGKHFVQRIALEAKARTNEQIAKAWVKKLSDAIREVDDRHMITVGVIPWAQDFKGAKPLFYAPEVGKPLDFTSIHFYPKANSVAESLEVLEVYQVGKPLVIEEVFPLSAGIEQTEEFLEKAQPRIAGFVSFYWGKTIPELEKKNDIGSAITAQWLKRFQLMAKQEPVR